MRHKAIVYLLSIILAVSTVNAEKYFVLDVNHIFGSVTFNSISLREIGRAMQNTDKEGFLVKTISFENSDIEKIYYNLSENKKYTIYIPYNENAARIEMYSLQNSKIMDIDVSSYANTCGNNICEGHESHESCTKDCTSGGKDGFCDGKNDGICDPDCTPKADADCAPEEGKTAITPLTQEGQKRVEPAQQTKEKPKYLVWILLASGVFVIVLLFLLVRAVKENKIISSLKLYINENLRRGFTEHQIKEALYREGYTEKEIDKAIKSI